MRREAPILARIQAALHAPDRFTRLTHFFLANILYSLPARLRTQLFAGEQYFCPICESHIRSYLVLQRSYHRFCPVCRSLQRHRFVWVFFKRTFPTLGQDPIRLLHIAPEPALASRFQMIKRLDYISADLYDKTAMVQMDVCNIQYPEESFDIIYCSHVLEHVADDRRALREFWRVLKPGGSAVILVPISNGNTYENPEITDPVERERIFGQHDHVRRYGMDFIERVEEAGFRVTPVQAKDLADQNEIVMYGLPDLEIIFFCKK